MTDLLGEKDKRADRPRQRSGCSKHQELDSFVSYLNRFKSPATVVFADGGELNLQAVLDYHPEGPADAGWSKHRATYGCPTSPEWQEWCSMADTSLSQDQLADFIESRLEDLAPPVDDAKPTSTKLLETMRNLRIYTKGTFKKSVNPATGAYELECKEEHDSKSTPIPRSFDVQLRVFEGGEMYRVEVRLSFRLVHGKPMFEYKMHRHAEIVRDAFGDIRKAVAKQCEVPVYAGTP